MSLLHEPIIRYRNSFPFFSSKNLSFYVEYLLKHSAGGFLMSYNFRDIDREQMYIMPPSLRDWLPEEDLVWFVLDAVKQMDLSKFYRKYRSDGWGGAAFEPSMMVSLLLYAYCSGERSSRRIECLCRRDIAFRIITANHTPDHCTIARFRQENEKELEGLFVEILKLCREAGLVKLGIVALDGTKVKANASLAANRTYASIEEEVKKILSEAGAKDAEEDGIYGAGRGGYKEELPDELRDPGSRIARLSACRERLKREAEESAKAQEVKISTREDEERNSGKKKRGRKPKYPNPIPNNCAKANVTDPDSRIMKTCSGYVQGYNAQVVVTEGQIILAAELTQEENDVHQLHPMLEEVEANLTAISNEEKVGVVVADAGYWSAANLNKENEEGPELLVATTKDWKQRKLLREKGCPKGRIPGDLSIRDRMERKLLTKRGRKLYKKRGQTVEPVFGQIKEILDFRGFMRRGQCACDSEWKLVSCAHNLLKLWRNFLEKCKGQINRSCFRGIGTPLGALAG
jgi:transposase